MNIKEFRQSIDPDPQPAYLLRSDQEYFRKKVFDICESQIDPGARAFDWNVFEAETDATREIITAARTLPWMSPRRWIFVREAHRCGPELGAYLGDPSPRSVLVLEASKKGKGWPARLPSIEFDADASVDRWLVAKASKQGYQMDRRAAEALLELVGDDLQLLDNEMEKQFLYQSESRRITLDSVLEMTMQSKQYDIFALMNSIAQRRSQEALKLLNSLYDSGNSPPLIVSMLYSNFRRLLVARERLEQGEPFQALLRDLRIWSYRGRERQVRGYAVQDLQQMLKALRDADRTLKSTSTDARIHLERFVVDMCQSSSV